MAEAEFYGPRLASVHHEGFGDVAAEAAAVVVDHLDQQGVSNGRVVDLGCGSGILARHVSIAGHTVVGVDISPAMVAQAERVAPRATFRRGSIHDVDLDGAHAVTAIGEIVNYAEDERAGLDALDALLGRVRRALEPGGLFLFDSSGPGRAGREGTRTAVREGSGWFITATSTERGDGDRLDRVITLFADDGSGHYERVDERHTLVLFDPKEIEGLCRAHGFTVERRQRFGEAITASTAPFGWDVFSATAPSS